MVNILFLQPWQEYKAGDQLLLENNVAHGLIERGVARLIQKKEVTDYENRMAGGKNLKSEPKTK